MKGRQLKNFVFHVTGLGLLVLGVAGCATFGVYNPATGRQEFIFISTNEEISMGENIHQEISREYRLLTNDPRVDRVRDIGGKLAKVSDRQDYPYHFFVIDKDEINAFTIPGGRIYFFTGLLNKLKTDEEIAAVLGHEIGHCAARHTVKKFQAALGYNLIGTLVLSQIGGSKERVSTLSRASNIAMQLALSAYRPQN